MTRTTDYDVKTPKDSNRTLTIFLMQGVYSLWQEGGGSHQLSHLPFFLTDNRYLYARIIRIRIRILLFWNRYLAQSLKHV